MLKRSYAIYTLTVSPTGEYIPDLKEQLDTLREHFIHIFGDRPTAEFIGPITYDGQMLISYDEVWFQIPVWEFPKSLQGYTKTEA